MVAALRPFSIAVGLDGRHGWREIQSSKPRLTFRERLGDRGVIGRIRLAADREIDVSGSRFVVFRTRGRDNYCAHPLRLRLAYLQQLWEDRKRAGDFNFRMVPCELHDLYVFYFCPRPVVLVSVAFEGRSNLFPMDLIGPTA